MGKVIVAVMISFGFSGMALAQEATEPCGPSGQLPSELSGNVADGSRCFELRMYTAEPAVGGKGGIDNLHQRFREQEVAIFEKHGAEIVAVWQRMLAYRDRAHREEVWAGFRADPEWLALRAKYEVPLNATAFMMSATDYSALK